MARVTSEQQLEVIRNFRFGGNLIAVETYGSGHINDTYLLTFEISYMGQMKAILQKMNRNVFPHPVEVMENIMSITTFLRRKIIDVGGDPRRETLTVIPTLEGRPYYKDSWGNYWRAYIYITDATSYDRVEKLEDFYQSAVAFGKFQQLLSDYPTEQLHETIKGFHDTEARFNTFLDAVNRDCMSRAASVQKEIEFVMERQKVAIHFQNLIQTNQIPLRVTHNDTKLNNIMIDNKTGKGICVIDLDTVMPGLAVFDFGDSIRFGANTAMEDERDLSKVSCDLKLFEAYTRGFLEGCNGKLTDVEVDELAMGAKVMAFECGMRFLTDYLQGDTYFKIHRPDHNLDRCRTQFRLVEDMENKWDHMQEIVQKYKS